MAGMRRSFGYRTSDFVAPGYVKRAPRALDESVCPVCGSDLINRLDGSLVCPTDTCPPVS